MDRLRNCKTRRALDGDSESVEIVRLLRTAAYYERLGCANVATSLRALAQAKRQRGLQDQDLSARH
ncbi:MAG: hypothetical protein RBS99_15170 [Rhodospirillales bacterium]|nr:hypothetical protein [Rhodospirillales bacterium]